MPGADLTLYPGSIHPIRVEFRESWGPSTPGGCYSVRAWNVELEAEIVAISSEPDCVVVPEPPIELMLLTALLALVVVVRRRASHPSGPARFQGRGP